MNEFVEKLAQKEVEISKEKGAFNLYALILREDASGKWDLLVAAPWIEKDKAEALKYLSAKIKASLDEKDLLMLSRIVIIEKGNPALDAIQRSMQIEHGRAEIKDSDLFGLQIKHAYLISSQGDKGSEDQAIIKENKPK
ncbi:MAG: hypothetical protein ACYC6O_04375 [Thermoleophilia bacterium]